MSGSPVGKASADNLLHVPGTPPPHSPDLAGSASDSALHAMRGGARAGSGSSGIGGGASAGAIARPNLLQSASSVLRSTPAAVSAALCICVCVCVCLSVWARESEIA
jgi:hypothetical protein